MRMIYFISLQPEMDLIVRFVTDNDILDLSQIYYHNSLTFTNPNFDIIENDSYVMV